MLTLPDIVRSTLESLVNEGYPYETCGLLVGRRNGYRVNVDMIFPARNLNRERAEDRYIVDPQDYLKADRAARAENREILGVWHSHPDHPAEPSQTDLIHAWPNWS
ncbi:MAG: M67 family metallopeptidase, partial [Pseudomonadota bacterium]